MVDLLINAISDCKHKTQDSLLLLGQQAELVDHKKTDC